MFGSMRNNLLALFLALAFSFPAFAQEEVAPIIYTRSVLRLIPKPEPKVIPSPLPDPKPVPAESKPEKGKLLTKAEAKKEEELKIAPAPKPEDPLPPPPPPRTPVDFIVDIKNPDFLAQDDFISHSEFPEHEGLVILYDPPMQASVNTTRTIGASDVIFINEDGFIIKIAPRLGLAELSEPIISGTPVRAILYIKPGGVEQDRITIGDRFENAIFKTHPVVLQ